ncbi:MAG: hypothetical protein DWQ04_31545 [Chloroflexi bacterium]|nr:MAG: hypothetical protein DWQ04_31545 [Chloroflexota bacterium]
MNITSTQNEEYHIHLRKLLEEYFSISELNGLIFDLELDEKDFPGDDKPAKIRALIKHCRRHSLLDELREHCIRLRASVQWPDIPSELMEPPLPPTENLQKDAGQGLVQLAESMPNPVVSKAVTEFKSDFEIALAGIEKVRYYKEQHDLFQEMEPIYNLILHNDRVRLDDDDAVWSELIPNLTLLQEPVDELVHNAEDSRFALRADYWLPMLIRGKEEMRTAIENKDKESLDASFRYFYRAIDRGLPRVNVGLVDAAVDLPFDKLTKALDSISSQLKSELSPETINRIVENKISIMKLDNQLNQFVHYHNDWQSLDDELRRIEANISNDEIEDLRLTWPDIQEMVQALEKKDDERWIESFLKNVDRLDKIIKSEASSSASVKRIFDTFRGQASRRFRQVDDQLLNLCQSLQVIGEPLNLLLSMI